MSGLFGVGVLLLIDVGEAQISWSRAIVVSKGKFSILMKDVGNLNLAGSEEYDSVGKT